MSTKRAIPLQRENEGLEEEFRAATRTNATAQAGIAIAVLLVMCYVAKLVLVTLIVSIFLAFMLEPIVIGLGHLRFPRPAGSFIAVLLLLAVAYFVSSWSYDRAVSFADDLPNYATQIRSALSHVRQKTSRLEQAKDKIIQSEPSGKSSAVPVKVLDGGSPLTRQIGAASTVAFALAFVPFLVYFMLTWHQHARQKTVKLFGSEHRASAHSALGEISSMMRTFIAGNFILGIFLSVCSMIVFAILHLPYFYFLGFISGFLSLIPYLGVILAIAAPALVGLGRLSSSGVLTVVIVVLALHIIAMNVLYPKLIGSRAQLNPLVVIIGLLVWGWMWGAMGLVLAIPIVAAIKIICDHVERLHTVGEWMGE